MEDEKPVAYTVAFPRLYADYVKATAASGDPDMPRAVEILQEIRNRCDAAIELWMIRQVNE